MLNTCSSYIISWLGFLPMQLVRLQSHPFPPRVRSTTHSPLLPLMLTLISAVHVCCQRLLTERSSSSSDAEHRQRTHAVPAWPRRS